MPTPGVKPRILGQVAPQAGVPTELYYTGPGMYGFMTCYVYSIYVSNLDFQSGEDLISIWIVKPDQNNNYTLGNHNALLRNYPIKLGENILKDEIVLWTDYKIFVKSEYGKSSFMAFGETDPIMAEEENIRYFVNELKLKVMSGQPLTPQEKEQLVLLTGGAYVIQNNTNNCNCS